MTAEKDDFIGPEEAIRNAINRGDFENLKGKGKPLDLNDYYDTPEDVRLGFSLLKNAGYIPEEVELLNTITELKTKIKETVNEVEKKELSKKLLETQLKYDLRMERFTKR
jgi:hypothetical protein